MTTTIHSTPEEKRAGYVSGLRGLADLLEQHPTIPLPYDGRSPVATLDWIIVSEDDPRAVLATIARALPGNLTKDGGDSLFELSGQIDGLNVRVLAHRDQVCERVVTGSREVTTEVPDPEALAAVPKITRTEVVEDVEWVCSPLLKPAAVSA